jgi:hypothetical protein
VSNPVSPRSSGIGTYVWETGHALRQTGHNVTIISVSDDRQFNLSVPLTALTLIRRPEDELGVDKRDIIALNLRALEGD